MDSAGRKLFDHAVPPWVDPDARNFFTTICCQRHGENQLCSPEIGNALVATARFYFEQRKWLPYVFLVMPDHVHMIVSFGRGHPMQNVISAWKKFTAARYGVRWQRDFFDHRLRTPPSFYAKEDYILQNPVRASLVKEASAWPYLLRINP